MVSGTINLSTGPVEIIPEVMQALASSPIPHRSVEFRSLYQETAAILGREYDVKHCFMLTGSGTLANEVMLHQLKFIEGKGLVLSNGEFGERLADQAKRIGLDHIDLKLSWGESFDLDQVNATIQQNGLSWLLFAHCETSTGMLNNLEDLAGIARNNNCGCYVDCMSTIGTRPMNLSAITMATASSGKGLASVPGLALVLSNADPTPRTDLASYLDLGQYFEKSGIPFTISSNMVNALNASLTKKLSLHQYNLNNIFRKKMTLLFSSAGIAPFADCQSNVFTLMPGGSYQAMLQEFQNNRLVISFESEYLRKRKWILVALFNCYTEVELETAYRRLEMILESIQVNAPARL